LHTVDELSSIESLPKDASGWGFCTSSTGWKIKNDDIPFELYTMEQARPKIAAIVRESVVRDDFLQPDPAQGYTLLSSNHQLSSAHSVSLTLGAGAAKPLDNDWSIRTGCYEAPVDESILTYPIYRSLFLIMISNWRCSWACVRGWKFKSKPVPGILGGTAFETTFSHTINWLGYLSADESRDLEPPADLIAERTPDGGLLLTSVKHRLDPANPDDMRRSRTLGEFMDLHNRDEWQPGGRPPARPDHKPRITP
jgi:hypothetical protein